MAVATPGWYQQGNVMRYWNGMEWTEETRPIPAGADVQERAGAIVPLGYVLAVLIPFVGFILGIVVATRPAKVTSKHGAFIILVSVIAFIIYIALIVNAEHNAATTLTITTTGNS